MPLLSHAYNSNHFSLDHNLQNSNFQQQKCHSPLKCQSGRKLHYILYDKLEILHNNMTTKQKALTYLTAHVHDFS